MARLDQETTEVAAWFGAPRFAGITRLHTPRQVVEQRGTIGQDYRVARTSAEAFYDRLRQLFGVHKSITTFGPYSPGQAVVMKRLKIEGIYLGGWATSAKGSITEDPGADLASYPLNQVPDEASSIVRALLTADKNQRFARSRMKPEQLAATPEVDYRPFIIADADTGHGGEAHVRNLIRRFVEVGVPGYHFEDQKPGVKKCGHQGGKVLVPQNEQIQRLNAARLQLDVMGVPGIIVARTDAEAANLLESNSDERDQPFILGATNVDLPSYKAIVIAIHRNFFELGVDEIRGHLMFSIPESEHVEATDWLTRTGVMALIREKAEAFKRDPNANVDAMLDAATARFLEHWQTHSGLTTYRQAVAAAIALRASQGEEIAMTVEEWLAFAKRVSLFAAREKAASLGIDVVWDCDIAKTPEGYYQIQGGLEYAIVKSLASAPFADILWMETATANLAEAKEYAEAIHAEFPEKMLAYNLSPSFSWDTTGMTEDEMKRFPEELGKLGFVFNFITYGGHQIDGLAAEEFVAALKQDGMLALARLQRKFRLLESPYRTPQTLAGGPRLDAALMAASGRTATTKAMGSGSTQHQHLVETEAPPKLLEKWLRMAASKNGGQSALRAELRPVTGGTDLLELKIIGEPNAKYANIVFVTLHDRRRRTVLSIREHSAFDNSQQSMRIMTLAHLFLIHRYKAAVVQYLTPTENEVEQSRVMEGLGFFTNTKSHAGQFIVADVNAPRVAELLSQQDVGSFVDQQLAQAFPHLGANA